MIVHHSAPEFQAELQGALERTGGVRLLDSLGEVSVSDREHCERSGDITMHVVAEMGGHQDRIVEAGYAASLHDVGKVDPKVQELITLARDLEPQEKEKIRQRHTTLGASMIRALEVDAEDVDLRDTASSVALYHHHTPRDFLSLVAVPRVNTIRMIQIIEQFDAMQDDTRPYHFPEPLSSDEALAAIEALLKERNAHDNLAVNTLNILRKLSLA